jgi:hypothetical protein
MMRSNPLVTEVLIGFTRQGKAHFDHLGLLLLQASVLFVLWPKGGVEELLASQHSPYTLAGVVMAMGIAMAYIALRAGAERFLLPGQHGLRDWALATPLSLGRVLRGYLAGQIVHSVHMLALSSPLLLMAFTVSGGEWAALGWCIAATLLQALFYRLCGAITYLTIGQHEAESLFTIRAILGVFYIPIGWFAPATSHLAFTFRTLDETAATQQAVTAAPDPAVFLATYAGLSVLAALILCRLLLRERRRAADSDARADFRKAVT